MLEGGLQQTESVAGGEWVDIPVDQWTTDWSPPQSRPTNLKTNHPSSASNIHQAGIGIRKGSQWMTMLSSIIYCIQYSIIIIIIL